MRNILNRIKLSSRKVKVLVASVLIVGVLSGAAVLAGFGPTRPVYDWNNSADRKGSLVGPVFNSFINTPTYGDERNLARIAPVVPGQNPVDADYREQQTAESGKEYWVRTFVHNNANVTTNCLPEHKDPTTGLCTQIDANAPGVAKNTKVRIAIAEGVASGVDIMSYISADNAVNKNGEPMRTVYDTATLFSDTRNFSVAYVPGSAKIYNRSHQNGLALSDAIVGANGTPIGFDQMNGNVPGCFEYSAYVFVKVKVNTPSIKIEKQVRKVGDTTWKENVDTVPGDTVQWLVAVTNDGAVQQNNVVVHDVLPPHLSYVANSAKWYNSQARDIPLDFNQLIVNNGSGGYDFGSYQPNGGNFFIRFDTKVEGDFDPCTITIRNIVRTRSKESPNERSDSADVRITRDDCEPEPIYSCDLLKADLVKNRNYKFTTNTTALHGAAVKQYHYDFGDDSDKLTTDLSVVEHTFPEEGTFKIKVTVDFNVGDAVLAHTSEDCEVVIRTKVPPVLPNTGAGDLVGIFFATSIAAALAHKFVWARRYNS